MAETEEEEDLLLEQHRAFVPGDDREAAEATALLSSRRADEADARNGEVARAQPPLEELTHGCSRRPYHILGRGPPLARDRVFRVISWVAALQQGQGWENRKRKWVVNAQWWSIAL